MKMMKQMQICKERSFYYYYYRATLKRKKKKNKFSPLVICYPQNKDARHYLHIINARKLFKESNVNSFYATYSL